jgi:hypothetical protein
MDHSALVDRANHPRKGHRGAHRRAPREGAVLQSGLHGWALSELRHQDPPAVWGRELLDAVRYAVDAGELVQDPGLAAGPLG